MKTIFKISGVILFTIPFLINSCKKDGNNDISDTVTDIDGNVYKTITIDTMVWMSENLKTTRFNDGTDIPLVTDNSEWINLATPGYCWYNNDELTNKNIYGALYNWFAVSTGKLCPQGWHVPGSTEWLVLRDNWGGWQFGGGPHKALGTIEAKDGLWHSPNEGATNESGFNAIPAGSRFYLDGTYYSMGEISIFWTSDDEDTQDLGLYTGFVWRNTAFTWTIREKQQGMSIRCIKDY
jgi:uncharacterized protein (TIGR02145 family)